MPGASDRAQELNEQLHATREIAEIAQQVVSRGFVQADVNLVVAARRVVELFFQSELYEDPLFLPIRGFEDETSELIIGPDRDKWAKELLDHVDNRVSVYLTENGQRIIEESLVRFRGSKRSFMTSVPGLIEKQRREVGSADGSRKTNFVNVMHSTISSFRRLRR